MKRIIIACDGTGCSPFRGTEAIHSNLSRLCRAFSNSPGLATKQIVLYQSGVGTQDLTPGGKFIDRVIGKGLADSVADGYVFIMNNYEPGDKLFMFGFSRGAFAARVLANIVARIGVFSKKYLWAVRNAMKAYRDGKLDEYQVNKIELNESQVLEESDIPWAYKVDIEVVGCWDTVASLGFHPLENLGGVSGSFKFFNGDLVKGIKHAFHALALDEYRGPFTPTLWYMPNDPEVAKSIDLQQCWFPGAHSNIGGAYQDRALANLTLAWMIDRCRPFLDFDQGYLNWIIKINRDPMQWHPQNKEKGRGKGNFDPVYQGWGCGMIRDSYKEGATVTLKYRTPGAYAGGDTAEMMHASVRVRWQTSRKEGWVWEPEALQALVLEKVGDVWHWVMDLEGRKLMIPEAPFLAHSFEGLLRYGAGARDGDIGSSVASVVDGRVKDLKLRIPKAPFLADGFGGLLHAGARDGDIGSGVVDGRVKDLKGRELMIPKAPFLADGFEGLLHAGARDGDIGSSVASVVDGRVKDLKGRKLKISKAPFLADGFEGLYGAGVRPRKLAMSLSAPTLSYRDLIGTDRDNVIHSPDYAAYGEQCSRCAQ